jgi:predicted enzyme related to lactoylglutathione lyase
VCWIEIPATNLERCQTFYKTVFGWEFNTMPNIPAGYVLFSKPETKLHGGMMQVKEEDLIQPKVNAEGRGQASNKITMRVEEVSAALKSIEAAGGKIIWYVLSCLLERVLCFLTRLYY